jgi:Tat protein translocase TatB subunit
MEFFGVGAPELLVILLITLLVVGPQRLPEMAAQLGRFMRAFQRYSSQVTREFSDTMKELEKEYDESKGDWKAVGQGLDEAVAGVNEPLQGAASDASLESPAPKTPATTPSEEPRSVAPPQ